MSKKWKIRFSVRSWHISFILDISDPVERIPIVNNKAFFDRQLDNSDLYKNPSFLSLCNVITDPDSIIAKIKG